MIDEKLNFKDVIKITNTTTKELVEAIINPKTKENIDEKSISNYKRGRIPMPDIAIQIKKFFKVAKGFNMSYDCFYKQQEKALEENIIKKKEI